jgi:hypothetical protein
MRPSALLALPLLLAAPAHADVLEVWGTHPGNLQGVIDLSDPGDVILIQPGEYSPITIPHALTLIGLADGVELRWMSGAGWSAPLVRLDGPGAGTVRLVGLDVLRPTGGALNPQSALLGGGFERLELLDCRVGSFNVGLTGFALGVEGISTTVPEVYLAETSVTGAGTNSDHYYFADLPGAPAILAPSIVARASTLTGGPAGDRTLYSGDEQFPMWGPGCAGFDPAVLGTVGCAAVATQGFVGQVVELVPGAGGRYWCCDGGTFGGPFQECPKGEFFFLGLGPSGPEFTDPDASVPLPANLDAPARTELGALYTLATDGGAGGGVLLYSAELSAGLEIPGFGRLLLADPQFLAPLPAGEGELSFVLPWDPDLIGQAAAFQAWTADAGLGVPVLTVIQP